MNYRIKVRKLEDTDFSLDCPFPNTDQDDYVRHLSVLVADINLQPGVINAIESNDEIDIESSLNKNEFWHAVEHLFVREQCHVKCVIVEPIA